jgi:transcriptional regulator with XRE-family HTH domain
MKDNAEQILTNLKDYLKVNGLKNRKIASIIGIHETEVSKMINGKKPIGRKFALKLAEHFGLSVQYLLSGVGPLESPLTPITGDETDEQLNTIATEAKTLVSNEESAIIIHDLKNENHRLKEENQKQKDEIEMLRKACLHITAQWVSSIDEAKTLSKRVDTVLKMWAEKNGISKPEIEAYFRACASEENTSKNTLFDAISNEIPTQKTPTD